MRWIIAVSARSAAVVVAAAAVLLVVGVGGLRNAAVDVLPEFLPTRVQVQTEALGLSTSEVEQLITVPLEDEFNGLAFLDHITSKSVPGLSVVTLHFHPGTDLYQARQLVAERASQGPGLVSVGTPPVMVQPLSAENRAMMVALSSATMTRTDLSTAARWRVRPRLLAVPGVANVVIWGQRDKQLQVLVDPVRMHEKSITLTQVINTAGDAMWTSPLTFVEASSPGADGFIDTPNQRLSIQHILPISTPEALASVPIEDTVGPKVPLGAVATVVTGHPAMRGDALLAGGPGFLLVVEKLPGADPAAVATGVEAAMAELGPGLPGVTVDTGVFRPATFVQSALRHLDWAAMAGALLLAAWLGWCWRSWRVSAIALVAIALPLVAASYLLYLRGTTFTTMTLAGLMLALGIVVDDAVRTVDAVRRTGREGLVEGCLGTRRLLGFALAVILLTAVPFLLLTGTAGAFAKPLMTAYLLAVVIAALVAATVVPALARLLLRAPLKTRTGGVAAIYERALSAFTRRGPLVFGAVAVLAVCALLVLPQLGSKSLIPIMQDRNLLVRWQAPAGTSLPAMEQVVTAAAATLRTVPGVHDVASDVGQALLGDQSVNVDSAQTWITLSGSTDYGAARTAIQHVLRDYPGMAPTLQTYPEAALESGPPQGGPALTVRVFGSDSATLANAAGLVRKSVANVRGVVDPAVAQPVLEPAVQIATDVDKAAARGLKPGDVRRATTVLMAGIPVGSYYQQQQIFDVAVWSGLARRADPSAIGNLMLDAPDGTQVALKDIAKVTEAPAPAEIDHIQASRFLDVTSDVRGQDLGGVIARVQTAVQTIAMPSGYHAEVFSDVAQKQSSDRRTLLTVLGVAVGVFLLLQAALRSWTLAVLLFLSAPLAVVGGAVTAPSAGGPTTAGALIAFLGVYGLAIRGGLSLLREVRQGERGYEGEWEGGPEHGHEHGHEPGPEHVYALDHDRETSPGMRADLMRSAARKAAFPTLVTAVGLTLALLPFAVVGDVAGLEVARPLALVTIGGLVSSTLVTLLVLPALYTRLFARTAASAPAQG